MNEEGFITRWSRLKQQQGEQEVAVEAGDQASPAEPPRDIHRLTDSDMPAIESLDESSDYSVFLSEQVSESLRQAALRKMFHLPALNVVDGLDDYAEDFTHFDPLGDILTHDMRRSNPRRAEQEGRTRGTAEPGGEEKLGADARQLPDTETGPEADPGPGEGETVAGRAQASPVGRDGT